MVTARYQPPEGWTLTPSTDGFTARDLSVRVVDASGTAAAATGLNVYLSAESGFDLHCQVTGSVCNSGTATMSVLPGEAMVINLSCPTASCTSNANHLQFGWRAVDPQ